MSELIWEYAGSEKKHLRINPHSGMISGVKILGTKSRNNREYPVETLKKAIPLYENAKVNLDHSEGDPCRPRSYQDRIGAIRNVRVLGHDGLFADFYFNPKHPLAEQLLWDAEHAPENVGFSHNVEAVLSKEKDRIIVQEIVSVRSVDLVADPATTSGLFESRNPPFVNSENENTALASDHGKQETIGTSDKCPDCNRGTNGCCENNQEIAHSTGEMKEQLESLQEALDESRRKIQLLRKFYGILGSEAQLAVAHCSVMLTQPFLEQLFECRNEKTMRDLVVDRIQLIHKINGIQQSKTVFPVSISQELFPGQQTDTGNVQSFVQSIT